MLDTQKLRDLFIEHGLRDTRHRRTLYRALMASTSHPTAEALYCKVAGHAEGMSMATVYNCLEAFCRAGLVRKHVDPSGTTRYDATVEDHVHTRCEKTGKLRDVPDELGGQVLKRIPKRVLKRIEEQTGFKIERVQVELVGRYRETADAPEPVAEKPPPAPLTSLV